MRYSVTVHIEVEATDFEAASDLVYAELDTRPSAGTTANPFHYIDAADVVACEQLDEDDAEVTV